MEDDIDLIASSVELPNGGVVPNRLVKVGSDHLLSGLRNTRELMCPVRLRWKKV